MSTTRYEVPPGGGFYVGIPGLWSGGDVFEVDDETGEVTLITRTDTDTQPHAPAASAPAPGEEAAAVPQPQQTP
jgi:hypothetical protein